MGASTKRPDVEGMEQARARDSDGFMVEQSRIRRDGLEEEGDMSEERADLT